MQTIKQQTFCGREFTNKEISLIQEVVATCGGISRHELANTVCELLEWKRPTERLKARECSEFLELLESKGALTLPEKKRKGQAGSQKIIPENPCRQPKSILSGSVEEFTPLEIQRIQNRDQRDLFKELIGRYHYLGYGNKGAESLLRLRALRSSNDFDEYWDFHETCEHKRNYQALYQEGEVPPTKLTQSSFRRDHLKVIK